MQRAVVFFSAVTVVLCGGCLACLEDFSIVFLNYGLQVVCAAITNFYAVFVESLGVLVAFGKCLLTRFRNSLPMFVCTFMLKGG